MKFVADLHLHSKYSRATSKDMDLEHLYNWAKIKGIKLLSAADFTHPIWLDELKAKLEPAESGFYRLKDNTKTVSAAFQMSVPNKKENDVRFMLTTEISCIYSKNDKVRKNHIILFAPSFEAVEKINARLNLVGNLKSDGRPILGLDSEELAKIALDASDECMVIPAHAWTPWFSIFGSKSGFDTIGECFGEYSKYIYALETGLSSDPPMNWRLSALDGITLISNSDSHSPSKIGREANVFDTEMNYSAVTEAIKKGDPKKFLFTVEFFPEEGKYHYDGHRACDIHILPKDSKKYNNVCPVCGKLLTIGVLHRVEDLADRKEGFQPEGKIPFRSLIPLIEIIADAFGMTVAAKKVQGEYGKLIEKIGNEFIILLEASFEDLAAATSEDVAEGIIKVREGKVNIEPGYDGVYGKINIFSEGTRHDVPSQKTLF